MVPHGQTYDWEQRFLLSSTTHLCTHMWRCMLFLLFRQSFDAFFLVLKASSVVNDARAINICGARHLAFFLRRLIERYERSNRVDLEQDEEVVVYLSGDLQATTNSWVWGSAETGTHLSRRQKHGRPKHTNPDSDTQSAPSALSPSWDHMLSEEEQHDWGGWQQIEQSARYLQRLCDSRQQHPHDQLRSPLPGPPVSTGPTPGPTLPPLNPASQGPDDNRSRMTITNFI